jgi:tRNA/rRNA methyltransferase
LNLPPEKTGAKLEALANIRVVLSQTSHPGNIGSAARAMKTMGLSQLALVRPRHFPHAEADALSAGAIDVLQAAQVHASLDEALAGCVIATGLTRRQRGLSHEPLDAREAAGRLIDIAQTQPVALLFGNETSGLSNEELSRCQMLVTFPANPGYPSLNLAAAVQIMAYELRMAALGAAKTTRMERDLARLEDIEFFFSRLEETLIDIRFLDPAHPKKLMPRLRRLFSRTQLEKEELSILMGILKQINLKGKVKVD